VSDVELPDAVFHADGDRFVPTDLARGPWDPNAQHGGAPAALLAHLVERFEPSATQVARLTIELLRPVPLVPLRVETHMIRPGKKVQLVGASLFADDTEVVRASAWRIRTADIPYPPAPAERLVPGPDAVPETFEMEYVSFGRAMEIIRAQGVFGVPGPAAVWFRLRRPVIAGEETSPLMRVAAAADFGNGISGVVTWDEHLFINPDLTIALHRYPVGEWIGLDAVTWPSDAGVGVAEAALYDTDGRIGRSVQTLLLDRR
jgi:hypothetical protein